MDREQVVALLMQVYDLKETLDAVEDPQIKELVAENLHFGPVLEYFIALFGRKSREELLRATPEQQETALGQMAAAAEDDYRNDPNLTDFEAFGEDDLFDETPGDDDEQ